MIFPLEYYNNNENNDISYPLHYNYLRFFCFCCCSWYSNNKNNNPNSSSLSSHTHVQLSLLECACSKELSYFVDYPWELNCPLKKLATTVTRLDFGTFLILIGGTTRIKYNVLVGTCLPITSFIRKKNMFCGVGRAGRLFSLALVLVTNSTILLQVTTFAEWSTKNFKKSSNKKNDGSFGRGNSIRVEEQDSSFRSLRVCK